MSVVRALGIPKRLLRLGMAAREPEQSETPSGHPGGRLPDGSEPAAASDADRAVTAMYGKHYRSLVRLAALLAGDVSVAEDVVQESFVAMHGAWSRLRDYDEALPYLRHSVVSRSRWIRRPPAAADEAGADRSAVISAVHALPTQQREALVLRLYLDLPAGQIAAAMGITPAAVQRRTAEGMAALRGVL